MRASLRCFAAVLALCAPLLIASSAFAQSVTAWAGQENLLARDKKPIQITTAPQRGTAAVVLEGTGPDQMSKLVYRPNDTQTRVSDQVTYTVDGGAPQTLAIEIEPKPVSLRSGAYEQVFQAVFLLFMLALVLESGLAVIFNWRPFVERFNARAVKPLLSFVAAYLLVRIFPSLDLITAMVNASTSATYAPTQAGRILTALVLAGGSSGVHDLLVTLGYRQRRTPETVAPKPPSGKAFLAVRLLRNKAVGAVNVFMGPPASPGPALLGTIQGTSKPVVRYFLSDRGRFPGYGGHAMSANTEVIVMLAGKDARGSDIVAKWGPHLVADGAIIDLELDL